MNVTPELATQLISMWARNQALPDPTKAAERAQTAVAVGRDDGGAIWGVGTATLGIVPSFGQPTYLYRQFFDVGSRGLKQTAPFLKCVRDTLEAWNASLPKPEFFIPPKGVRKSRASQVFTHTIPASSFSAMRWARGKFWVQRVADNPYSVAFALARASASVSKRSKVTTGPKISSCMVIY